MTRILKLSLATVSFAGLLVTSVVSLAADSGAGNIPSADDAAGGKAGGATGTGGSPAGQPTAPDTKTMGGQGGHDTGGEVGARPPGSDATTRDTRHPN